MEANAEEHPIVELFRHNVWANLRLLDACAGLSDEQLDSGAPGGFGPIRDTLTHVAGSEERYLAALTGTPPAQPLKRGDRPGLAELRERLRASGEAFVAVAGGVRVGDIVHQMWQGQETHTPAPHFLVQAINHATEHRTQVK